MAEERIGIKIEIYDPCGRCTIKDKCAKNIDQQAFLIDPHSCFQYKLLHRLPTKAEVIERMAKGIHYYEWAHDKHFPKWNELNSDIQNDYKNMAEAALNALLGE